MVVGKRSTAQSRACRLVYQEMVSENMVTMNLIIQGVQPIGLKHWFGGGWINSGFA